jgi:Protein of unknown function (DUF1579)
VGRWQVEGEVASGKFKATSTCEWFEGHFHVICRSDATTPEGNSKTLEVLTYDTSSGAYTHYNIGSLRENSLFSTGKLEGKTWRWHAEPGTQGQKQVYDSWWTETSANSYR